LRVVPRSHRLGMLSHWSRQTRDDLASSGMTDREPGSADGDDNELSVKLAKVPEGLDAPFDVVMKAGEMSFHHPLALHGSNPNASAGPRIGLSATYSTPGLHKNSNAVALVRGSVGAQPSFSLSSEPADLLLEEAVATYRSSGRQLMYAPG
jgi:ectoine hydroxylase-related dioxygenase (phytanoyl-CoA dioxygenase family)